MVHALNEIRRVLSPRGILVDLRPLLDRWPVEVAWTDGYREAGRATDLAAAISDDTAANAAIEETVSRGGFEREHQEAFPVFFYWDTPRDMRSCITEEWGNTIAVDKKIWTELGTLWASAGAEARVRLRLKMLIARYQKRA